MSRTLLFELLAWLLHAASVLSESRDLALIALILGMAGLAVRLRDSWRS